MGQGTGGAPGPTAPSPNGRRVRRLSNREYNNVVRDLLGASTRPADTFIADSYQNGYDNGSVGLVVQSDQADAFAAAAEALAATAVAEQMPRLAGGCAPEISGDVACAEAFLSTFPPRAFRRPLTTTEAARLRGVYDQGALLGGFQLGVQLAVETVLQSPQFLYREELGIAAGQAVGPDVARFRLTSFEVASALSFLLTGTMPDAILLAAAAEGRLNAVDDYRRETRRLLGTPAARETMRVFLHQWLATDRLESTLKDPAVYPTFNKSLAASMREQLNRDFDQALWGGGGALRELFTSSQSFVDPPLAALYGVAVTETGFTRVALPAATRKGVLTRAGFLAVHSDPDSSGPIGRGVFLLANVLCAPPLPRPATVPVPPTVVETVMAGRTTRQRFEQHVSNPGCLACHRSIDGIGFGFEEFDGLGVYRASENGAPVDSSGMLYSARDLAASFAGVSDLTTRLMAGRDLPDCFVRQVYRLAMGQVETAADQALLLDLQRGFSVDQPLADLLLALISDPAFVVRNTVQVLR